MEARTKTKNNKINNNKKKRRDEMEARNKTKQNTLSRKQKNLKKQEHSLSLFPFPRRHTPLPPYVTPNTAHPTCHTPPFPMEESHVTCSICAFCHMFHLCFFLWHVLLVLFLCVTSRHVRRWTATRTSPSGPSPHISCGWTRTARR